MHTYIYMVWYLKNQQKNLTKLRQQFQSLSLNLCITSKSSMYLELWIRWVPAFFYCSFLFFLHLHKTLCQFGGQNHQPPQLKELESAAEPFAKLLQLGLELEKFLEPSNELKLKPRQLTLVFDEITSSCAAGSLASLLSLCEAGWVFASGALMGLRATPPVLVIGGIVLE